MKVKAWFGTVPLMLGMLSVLAEEARAIENCGPVVAQVAAEQVLRSLDEAPAHLHQAAGLSPDTLRPSDLMDAIVHLPSGQVLLVGHRRSQIWNINDKHIQCELEGKLSTTVRPVIAADGSRIVGIGADQHTLHVWDSKTGSLVSSSLPPEGSELRNFSPGGGFAVATRSKEETLELAPNASMEARIAALRHRAANRETELYLLDVTNGREVRQLRDHQSPVELFAFSDPERWLLTASRDGLVRVENTANGALHVSLGLEARLRSASVSEKANKAFVLTRDGKGFVLSLEEKNVFKRLPEDLGYIHAGEIIHGGEHLLLTTDHGVTLLSLRSLKPVGHISVDIALNYWVTGTHGSGKIVLSLPETGQQIVWSVPDFVPLSELVGPPSDLAPTFALSDRSDWIGGYYWEDAYRMWNVDPLLSANRNTGGSLFNLGAHHQVRRTVAATGYVDVSLFLSEE